MGNIVRAVLRRRQPEVEFIQRRTAKLLKQSQREGRLAGLEEGVDQGIEDAEDAEEPPRERHLMWC